MKKTSVVKIGKKLQAIRKSNGYTQEKLAEEIDVSVRYISDIEQDNSKPSYDVLIRICNLYNIGLNDIFSEYLQIAEKPSIPHEIAGFDKLNKEDKKTIEHLIMYFNKK